MTTSIMNVLKPSSYVNGDGKEITTFTQVAVAFPHKDGGGCTVKIPEGVYLTGEIIVLPRTEKASNHHNQG